MTGFSLQPQENVIIHPELLADGKTPKGKLVGCTEGAEVREILIKEILLRKITPCCLLALLYSFSKPFFSTFSGDRFED